jgi:hypothetical protein
VPYGSTIVILGESFKQLDIHADNPSYPQLDEGLRAIGK